MQISRLNLPAAQVKLRDGAKGTEIFDPLRGKWVVLTPEEWVRQQFTAYLESDLGYPSSLMGNEIAITLNNTSRRCDTIVYDRSAMPVAIVEYKAPTIRITQKTFDQIARYNMVLQVPFLIATNGLSHFCCRLDFANHRYIFLREIPRYEVLLGHIGAK